MKIKKPDKNLMKSKYRKEMWETSVKALKEINKVIPISEAYVMGSFTSKKTRPSDVDFILFLKTKKFKNKNFCLDISLAPENEFGQKSLKDAEKWTKERYGSKNSGMYKIV